MHYSDEETRSGPADFVARTEKNDLKQQAVAEGPHSTSNAACSHEKGEALVAPSGGAKAFDKYAFLREHLFAELGSATVNRLASYARIKRLGAGTIIFERGDPGGSLFAVRTGTVKITNYSIDGKNAVLNFINAGQIFGEIAVLDGRPRTASAVAATDCELIAIERRDLAPLIASMPELALKLIEVLCCRVRQTSEQVEDVMFLSLPARLAKTLLSLATDSQSARSQKVRITQREIGQIIGMSRESTNKQLRCWKERNWLRLERGGIVILDVRPLKRIAEGDDEFG